MVKSASRTYTFQVGVWNLPSKHLENGASQAPYVSRQPITLISGPNNLQQPGFRFKLEQISSKRKITHAIISSEDIANAKRRQITNKTQKTPCRPGYSHQIVGYLTILTMKSKCYLKYFSKEISSIHLGQHERQRQKKRFHQ